MSLIGTRLPTSEECHDKTSTLFQIIIRRLIRGSISILKPRRQRVSIDRSRRTSKDIIGFPWCLVCMKTNLCTPQRGQFCFVELSGHELLDVARNCSLESSCSLENLFAARSILISSLRCTIGSRDSELNFSQMELHVHLSTIFESIKDEEYERIFNLGTTESPL